MIYEEISPLFWPIFVACYLAVLGVSKMWGFFKKVVQ